MNMRQNNEAASQMISAIILLAIAILAVSIIYTQVLAVPGPQDIANVTIIGKIEDGHPVFDFQRGETLEQDTKMYINIAGDYNKSIYSLNESFLQQYINNLRWNIGERIVLPSENLPSYKGPQVEGMIVDAKTNAIIFWGILQEGLVTKYKGGIWHFNESSWNGIPNEVIDSSGNQNHGIAIGGANITLNGRSNNAGYFDGYDDVIQVDTSWSLNMTKTITVEAWMKPLFSDYTFGTIPINESFGYTPYIIHTVGDYYAVVSEDLGKSGMIQTIKIPAERYKAKIIDEDTFGNSKSKILLRPMITQMTDYLYLVAYNNILDEAKNKLQLELRTYNISTIGLIQYTNQILNLTSGSQFNTYNPNRPWLQKITDTLCAVAYWNESEGGIIKIVNITSSTGEIKETGKSIRYDSITSGKEQYRDPCLIHINGNFYAIAYHNASTNHGILKIFNITSSGDISGPIDEMEFESIIGREPNLIRVTDQVCAIVYRNNLNHGCVKTFNVSSNGIIEWTNKMVIFPQDNQECFDPCIVRDTEDLYVVAYSTADDGSASNSEGYVITMVIKNNGSIVCLNDSRRRFDEGKQSKCFTPVILPIAEHLFCIGYTSQIHHVGIVSAIFYGGDSYGVYKGNAFVLSSFQKTIQGKKTNIFEGRINNITLFYNTTEDALWHHLVLTYDGSVIRLYIDGLNRKQVNYLNHDIILSSENLYFGQYYYGYIDEIAIYEKALNDCQINYTFLHPTQPNLLEYYLLGNNCNP